MRTTDDELTCWIDMVFDIIIEKAGVFGIFRFNAGNKNMEDVVIDLFTLCAR